MIEVSNLVKKYGDHTAVDHLSFQIEKGKIYGFLGPNGAGKSTTMNMITGYIASTEGKVMIDGHDIKDFSRHDLRSLFGMVLQDTWLFDVYAGSNLPENQQSLAFALIWQDVEATLSDERVSQQMDTVLGTLHQQFNAALRV